MRWFILVLLLVSCNTYRGVVTVKGCCPYCLELEVGNNWYVIPGNTLEWFDSLSVGDSAIIDKNTLRIIKKL